MNRIEMSHYVDVDSTRLVEVVHMEARVYLVLCPVCHSSPHGSP
jgi:hypothetical protein